MTARPPPAADYRSTVFLPRTDFPMRGALAEREPEILARWERIDLYALLRQDARGRPKFVLHDGPPYANNHIHLGTALNKVLKDVVNRTQQMAGRDAVYIPGWDCHGLPIEWQIEEQLRRAGRRKADVPVAELRQLCRDSAEHWIDVQRAEFKRLGVLGDWDRPYKTMDFAAEAAIFGEFAKFLMQEGALYRGDRPVLWSVVEQTALADAEVEYHDHVSTQIWVRFPVVASPNALFERADVVIWTTTPWTMPGNRAVAYNPELLYALVEVAAPREGSLARAGDRLLIETGLVEQLAAATGFTAHKLAIVPGRHLAGTVLAHPWRGQGYEFDVPLLPGAHVTDDQGSGFVHTAPGHGVEDFALGREFGLELPMTVAGDGTFYDHVPLFAGQHVFKVDGAVIEALKAAGKLLGHAKFPHSYPHSWRSRAPLIFRTTPQWFISMTATGLRAKALAAIEQTGWVPAIGRNRIEAMVEQRPDWCISRQRSWGVPLAVFLDKRAGAPLRDPAVNDRIAAAFAAEGGDAWFASPPERFLGDGYRAADFEQVKDVIEVWFDSGSTHAFVLEARAPETKWPADLYLEGSDQHRGWFQTSLLEACGTRGRAPFERVLTHGFLLDEHGRKMSKSLGNMVSPMEIAKSHGIDILRLWVIGSDYTEDLHFGPEILKFHADIYRRLRNTLRYLLGALDGFAPAEAVEADETPELERWVLHRLAELDEQRRHAVEGLELHIFVASLHAFCATDLSAFYFDVRKDALYCDAPGGLARRAARTVMMRLFESLTLWLAPILCFTAEEAWSHRPGATGEPGDSVHRQLFPAIPAAWRDDTLGERWRRLRELRAVVTAEIERARARKAVGSSLQAWPAIALHGAWADLDVTERALAELCITSGVTLTQSVDAAVERTGAIDAGAALSPETGEPGAPDGVIVRFERADHPRCERCWKYLPEVGRQRDPNLCARCDGVVAAL